MTQDENKTILKQIDVRLLKEDARTFERFKKALEDKIGIDNLNNTDVIKWLINHNTLGE
jgi:hypothetical protein|tara:strand:+ start:362 stop:538 length:177 start_codon:yes stop_codon:yes gene_type:complete